MSVSEYTPPPITGCRISAHSMKKETFPGCARKCLFVEVMGVGECESCCPWKFDTNGNPIVDGEELRRKRENSNG